MIRTGIHIKLEEPMFRHILLRLWSDVRALFRQEGVSDHQKNIVNKLYELTRYRLYWGHLGSMDYFEYGLDVRKLSIADILAYIPTRYHNMFQRFIRNNSYNCLVSDKFITSVVLEFLGLPHAKTILVLKNGKIVSLNCKLIQLKEYNSIINEPPVDMFFVKPCNGGGAQGIKVFKRNGKNYFDDSGNEMDYSYLSQLSKKSRCDFIVQRGEFQSEVLSKLNPDCLNTLRVITHRSGDGGKNFQNLSILLKVGRVGYNVDNSCVGGVFIRVDSDTFITDDSCYIRMPEIHMLGKRHPDSGAKVAGIKLPFRDDVLRILEKGSQLLYPQHPYLGWDIALTLTGAKVIEINSGFAIEHHQIAWGQGLRDVFGYDPKCTPLKSLRKYYL